MDTCLIIYNKILLFAIFVLIFCSIKILISKYNKKWIFNHQLFCGISSNNFIISLIHTHARTHARIHIIWMYKYFYIHIFHVLIIIVNQYTLYVYLYLFYLYSCRNIFGRIYYCVIHICFNTSCIIYNMIGLNS